MPVREIVAACLVVGNNGYDVLIGHSFVKKDALWNYVGGVCLRPFPGLHLDHVSRKSKISPQH
jgi:hypothetical protein